MARVIAIVTEMSGEFFAKNQNGKIIELTKGIEILEGMVVYSNNNNPSDTINIHSFSGQDIVLAGNQEQLFDVTMIDSELADLDVALDEGSIASIVATNSADAGEYENEEDIFSEETASGDEKEKEEGDIAGGFAARDGNIADVNSDLRDARFKILSNSYEVKSRFEREDGDRLEMINNNQANNTNNPSRPTPIESPIPPTTTQTTPPPPTPTPPVSIPDETPPVTPPIPLIAATVKLFAADSDGKVQKETNGDYKLANTAYEGSNAKYIAYAFKEGETTFNDSTKLPVQAGKVKVEFTDGTATGVATNTATDGSEDFINSDKTITIGKAFDTSIILDTKAEGDEDFTVAIKDGSYESSTNSYKSVETDTDAVTTTIKDAKLFVKIEAVTDTAQEGGSLKYKVTIVNSEGTEVEVPAGKSIKVDLDYSDNGTNPATSGDDYTPVTSVTIDGGESSKTFDVVTKDDYYAEGDEGLKITIGTITNNDAFAEIEEHTTANGAPSDAVEVTGTIKDNPVNNPSNDNPNTPTEPTSPTDPAGKYGEEDSVYAIITGNTTVDEGNTTTYTVSLVDKDGNAVTVTKETEVTVKYTNTTTQDGDTEHNNNALITVKIPADGSSNTFTVGTIDDYIADNGEKYNVAIEKVDTNEFENVVIGDKDGTKKDVTTEIKDNTTSTPNANSTTETNQENVILKIVACDANGNPILDGDKYTFINDVNEGADANYMVVAFKPNTTDFTEANKASVQGGTVTIKTANDGATGATSATKIDGSQDYISETEKEVKVGESFTIKTIDDYRSDNDEAFKVSINDKSYKHPDNDVTKAIYENVTTNTDAVTTTIKDNTTAKNQTVIESSVDNSTTPSYGKEDTVYAVISANKSSAIEGNSVTYTVKLVDKDGIEVKVTSDTEVTVKFDSATTNGAILEDLFKIDGVEVTDTGDTGSFNITIANGSSSKDFTIQTKDDFTTEGDESFDISIEGIDSTEFENLVFDKTKDGNDNKVTTTIKDGVTPGTPTPAKIDEDNFVITDDKPQITTTESLDITSPNADNAYTLDFESTVKVFKGDADSNTDFAYDGGATALKSGGKEIAYVADGNTITGYAGTGRAETDKVFVITLDKNGVGGSNDSYTYTQYLNIDHPVSGSATDNTNDDDITFEFGFKITDQGQTSETQKFKVTVNDSMPFGGEQEFVVNEDSTANKFIISQENFKDGKIEISNDGGTNYTNLSNGGTIAILDPNDAGVTIGTLTNNGDGTVTFVPVANYSNYNAKPKFSYKVSDNDGDFADGTVNITVRPVADAPTITVADVTTTEDDGNTKEGTHKVGLGLKVPDLSTDKTDINATGKTGDNPERNGEITLTFGNGKAVEGAKIFSAADEKATINSANQEVKIVIVTTSGGTDIDRDYHHADVTTGQANTLYLTKDEYEALTIQHAEDNDTDIKIKIGVTSLEVDDSGKPLFGNNDYADKNNADLKSETTADMTVKINPVTDKFTLNWDGTNNDQVQSVDTGTKTVIFNNITENNSNAQSGDIVNNSLDLKALLTPTSGKAKSPDTSLDLDGSEKRSYTIKLTETDGKELPEFIYITIGTKKDVKAFKDANDEYTVAFDAEDNKVADPDFSMKFPDYWSGKVNGTITLKSIDKGADSSDTAGNVESDSVNFEVTVTPVANISTIKVEQSIGFEDAGRSEGNSGLDGDGKVITSSDTIDDAENGIPLKIKVSSDDEDGSESFNVKIGDIPDGGSLYVWDSSLNSDVGDWVLVGETFTSTGNITINDTANGTYEVIIKDFQNDKLPKFIPPHNSDADFTLKVSSQTVDGTDTRAFGAEKDISVIVKNVADAPVGTEIKDKASIDASEDTEFNLKDIYTTPANLASYDGSEELTVKIDFKETGITIATGSPYHIENGEYVVKASDIKAEKIKLDLPKDFSGDTSFDLTYVTTEKAGEGDSKTWNKQTVNIFVKPVADDVEVATSSTIYEDADGSANKIDLKPTLIDTDGNGVETITSVKILGTSVPAEYKLYSDASMSSELTKNGDGDYIITDITDSIYAKNATEHSIDGDFTLKVEYTVKDTNGSSSDEKTFEHDHVVNVKAVTDAPGLSVGTIEKVGTDGDVTIDNTTDTVTIKAENSSFKVPVTTKSSDKDGSEEVTEIVISGVPMGVSVEGATYYGYSGSEHNGIWVIDGANLKNAELNSDAQSGLQEITFKVNQGADFENRDIKITTFTKDSGDAKVESASQTITIEKTYTPGTGTGTPAELELATKTHDIKEDTEFSLAEVLEVSLKSGGSQGQGGAIITFTDIAEGSTVSGHSYSYVEGGKTYYVVVGNGNAADMNTKLSNVKITTPTDVNSLQVGALKGDFKFTADIATHHDGGFKDGNQVTSTQNIAPVTDAMTVAVVASGTLKEDDPVDLKITLTNPSDGTKTELVGSSLAIKVTEDWKDSKSNAENGTKGTLTQTGSDYDIVESPDGTYTITKTDGSAFPIGIAIEGLQYTPASNRDGKVDFEVTVQNKETGSDVTLNSSGDTTIKVTPVVDAVLNASTVIATGTEDEAITGIDLANPVKLTIEAKALPDKSETFGNIILDEVPNGFTVWYKVGTELVMATNIGKSGGTDFDLTPNIAGDADVHRNKWLVPATSDGSLADIYINAPTNWAGDFDFKAKITVKEQNGGIVKTETVEVIGKITPVADGVEINPSLTYGDAFSWVDLNLNANMIDVDGSETMSLELSGLNESAQFRLLDGTEVSASFAANKWTISGIAYDQINNIQLSHDKSVTGVSVKATTVEEGNDIVSSAIEKTFNLTLTDVSGKFTLDDGISLNFDNIDDLANEVKTLKNISEIDLRVSGENKLENLTLQDVLDMTDGNNELTITGTGDDKVTFKSGDGWTKTDGTDVDAGFKVYTNSTATVKIEDEIQQTIG